MAMQVELRGAQAQDCPAIAQVHVASWQAAYAGILDAGFLAGLSVDKREQAWRQVLQSAQSQLLLACSGQDVIGFASFGPCRDADAPAGRGELWALYLRPQSWSTGAGRKLWQAAHAQLQSRGCSSVSLWVLEKNLRAIGFYSAMGFAREDGSEKEFELGGVKVRELRMIL